MCEHINKKKKKIKLKNKNKKMTKGEEQVHLDSSQLNERYWAAKQPSSS